MNDAAAKRSWPPRGWTLLGAGVLLAVWAAGMAVAVAWGDRSAGGRAGAAFAGVVCLTGSLGGWLMARLGDRLAAHAAAGRRTWPSPPDCRRSRSAWPCPCSRWRGCKPAAKSSLTPELAACCWGSIWHSLPPTFS